MTTKHFLLMAFAYVSLYACKNSNNEVEPIPEDGKYQFSLYDARGIKIFTKTGEATYHNAVAGKTQINFVHPDFSWISSNNFNRNPEPDKENNFAELLLESNSKISKSSILKDKEIFSTIFQRFYSLDNDWAYNSSNGELVVKQIVDKKMTGTFEFNLKGSSNFGNLVVNPNWGDNIKVKGSFAAICNGHCD